MKYRIVRPDNWREVNCQEGLLRDYDLRLWFADWMESNGWQGSPEYVATMVEARANCVAYLRTLTGGT